MLNRNKAKNAVIKKLNQNKAKSAVIKGGGGGCELNLDDELAKGKVIAVRILQNNEIQNFVKIWLKKLVTFVIIMLRPDLQLRFFDFEDNAVLQMMRALDEDTLKTFLNYMHPVGKDQKSCGQVEKDLKCIINVIANGNIRERLTLINNIASVYCDLLWKLIIMKHDKTGVTQQMLRKNFISEKSLNERISRIENYLGIDVKSIVSVCTGKEQKPGYCMDNAYLTNFPNICSSATAPRHNAIISSRLLKPICRKSREGFAEKLAIQVQSVFPPLSEREISYITSSSRHIKMLPPDTLLPWVTGRMYYEKVQDSFFVQLNETQLCKPFLTGPSGSIDLMLDCIDIFRQVDDSTYKEEMNMALLACIGWMAIVEDHTIYEMLIPVTKFNFSTYKTTDDEYEFVEKILKSVQSNSART